MITILQLNTLELRAGMILRMYGGRFQLTARVYDDRDVISNTRVFTTKYLGTTKPGTKCSIPEGLREDWRVQGNKLATWVVETD